MAHKEIQRKNHMNKMLIILCLFFSFCSSLAQNTKENIVGDLFFSNPTIKCESIRFINTCKQLNLLDNHSFFIIKLTNLDSLNNNDKLLFIITLYDHMHLRPWDNLIGYVIHDGYPIAVIGNAASNYFEKSGAKENAVIKYENTDNFKWENHLYTRWYYLIDDNKLCLKNYFPKNITKDKYIAEPKFIKYNSVKYVEENTFPICWRTSLMDVEISCDSDFLMLPIAVKTKKEDIIINPHELPVLTMANGLIYNFYREIFGLYSFSSNLYFGNTLKSCLFNAETNFCNMENNSYFSISMEEDGLLVLPDSSSVYVNKIHTHIEFPVLVKSQDSTKGTFSNSTGIMIYDCYSWFSPDKKYPIMESIKKRVVDKDYKNNIKDIVSVTFLYSW